MVVISRTVEAVKWDGGRLLVRQNVASDSLRSVSKIIDGVLHFSSIGGIEMIHDSIVIGSVYGYCCPGITTGAGIRNSCLLTWMPVRNLKGYKGSIRTSMFFSAAGRAETLAREIRAVRRARVICIVRSCVGVMPLLRGL
jgi:hypothetical protein